MAKAVLTYLADLLFPRSCKVCGIRIGSVETPGLCAGCWSTTQFLDGPCCPRCGKPFVSEAALSYSPNHHCGDCREKPPHYDRAISVALYDKALAEAIHLFKYSKKNQWAKPLGRLLLKRVSEFGPLDVVLPVPLHPKRLREREFNQSLLLAREVSLAFGIPLQGDNLHRVRWTRPQVELNGEERRKNVRKAFEVKWPDRLEDRCVLLIDDVLTTGATVNECARVLKRAGAKTVNVLTLARMVPFLIGGDPNADL
jgi:ComF family protein